jgi:NDP-sugar pyrophosphorylase family protein
VGSAEGGESLRVAVLAGGLGTRLGALARGLPKPMIMVAGRPFLEYVVDSFAKCGLEDFVFLVGHHADVIEAHFGRGDRFGVRVEYSREKELLGTGGAIRDAIHLLGDRFLLTYGDVLRRFDYDRFVREHSGSCLAVYRYSPDLTTIAAGNVGIDEGSRRVTTFVKNAPELRLPWVDAGFSVIDSKKLELLPPFGAFSFEETMYPELAQSGELEYEIVNEEFYDIGNPADLARTRLALEGWR